MTGLSYVTLRRLVKGRKIRATRIGRRVLIPVIELRKLVGLGAKPGTSR
jgi:excisionase family DNA binding protein